ncbi:hypothetical protein RVW00_000747 [Enterobacter bugandensis]|nr:hypothetical protein [Enterobacter bugandensis]
MTTRNVPLTSDWLLITSGPVSYMSVDVSQNGKYSGAQLAFGVVPPAPNFEGHPIPEIRGVEVVAGENLYARATGQRALIIVTQSDAVSTVTATRQSAPVAETTMGSRQGKLIKQGKKNG